MTTEERFARIAELIVACPEPGIASGMDMCICGSGEVWPCSTTQAAWLAGGLTVEDEMRRQLEPVKQQMADKQAMWEALNEEDPEAARWLAAKDLGW